MKNHALLFGVAFLLVGCTTLHVTRRDDSCGPPNTVWQPLASLGQGPNPVPLSFEPEAHPDSPRETSFSYRFELENAGTKETLRAIVFEHDTPPIVVGDRGTALIRDSKAGWLRESTGIEENLYALVRMPEFKEGAKREEVIRRAPLAAVGAHGTALMRGSDGAWRKENTGTQADLFAVSYAWGNVIAAGQGGLLLERSADGVWHEIPTYTKADFFALGVCSGGLCAAGASGTIVECKKPEKTIACVPRAPATTADLHVITEEEQVLGKGVWLSGMPTNDREDRSIAGFRPWPYADESVEKGDARAFSNNHWVGLSERLVAGMDGAVWFVGNWVVTKKPVRRLALPYQVNFYGSAYDGVDGFLIGEHGTIVKLAVIDFIPPKICLL